MEECRIARSKFFAVDYNYMYSFDKSDIPFIRKYTETIKEEYYNSKERKLIREWHRNLERWVIGEHAVIYGKKIKPLQITTDKFRVTNEMLQKITRSFAGEDFNTMAYAAIGDGADAGNNPSPNDTDLQNEVARINVLFESGGGALSVEGTTYYSVANFDKNIPSCDANESGIFDREKPGTGASDVPTVDDTMGEHSIFDSEVEHEQGEDAIGVTSTIYFCAS